MRTSGAKTDQMSWDDLRIALSLAREGSIRSAARALGVSHSTVLRRLRELEAVTGVRLFERKLDGYEATAAGQDVFDTASDVEDVVLGLERRVAGRDLRLSGPVRVTLPDPFVPLFFPVFRDFGRAHPGIELTLAAGTGYSDLAHRAADVALRITAEPPPELVGRRLATVAVGVYGSNEYLRGRALKELEALDWIGFEADSSMAFAQWMRARVPNARIAMRVSANWTLREAVDAGAGVTLLPCALGDLQPGWRRVALIRELSAPLWILSHRDLRTTARVRVLRDFVADAVVRQRSLIEGRKPRRRAR
jgi:DNA-binding transcriptional LysR family regulator